jgi:hypothetical protein
MVLDMLATRVWVRVWKRYEDARRRTSQRSRRRRPPAGSGLFRHRHLSHIAHALNSPSWGADKQADVLLIRLEIIVNIPRRMCSIDSFILEQMIDEASAL